MDDEELICDVTSEMLKLSGFSAETALDGKIAIEKYKKAMESGEPFDIVIMDLTIPGGVGGEEAIKEILAIDKDAKAIVSSGYSHDPIMAQFEKYGFKGVVAKPYTMSKLQKVIKQILGK